MSEISDRELKVNGSGAPDPTAYQAIKNIEEEERRTSIFNSRMYKLVGTIYNICNFAGVKISGTIVFTDDEGRTYKVKKVKN